MAPQGKTTAKPTRRSTAAAAAAAAADQLYQPPEDHQPGAEPEYQPTSPTRSGSLSTGGLNGLRLTPEDMTGITGPGGQEQTVSDFVDDGDLEPGPEHQSPPLSESPPRQKGPGEDEDMGERDIYADNRAF